MEDTMASTDMENEMERIFRNILPGGKEKEQNKIQECIKLMQHVEDEMTSENKKIIAELKKIQIQAKSITKNEELKLFEEARVLDEEIVQAKALKDRAYEQIVELKELSKALSTEDARELPLLTEDIKDSIKKIQDEAKKFKLERRRHWDDYYMKIACLAASRSKDPSTAVS